MALLLILVLAPAALATVRDEPVTMVIIDPPGDLASGESHIMTLRFEAFRPASVEAIKVLGQGWSVATLGDPGALFMTTGESQDVRMEVTPIDPEEPLEIQYRADDRDHRVSFDPRATGWKPGVTEHRGDAPPRLPSTRNFARPEPYPPTPSLAEQDPRFAVGKMNPEMTTTSIRVTGRVIHSRQRVIGGQMDDRIDIGADGATVRIFDWNNYLDLELTSVVTDEAGYFDVTFDWYTWPGSDTYPDLFVRIEASSGVAIVHPPNNANAFRWDTDIYHNFNGTLLGIGEHGVFFDEPALQILTSLTRTWRWFLDESGRDAPLVGVSWPDGDTSAWYSTPSGTMHISSGRSWREDTHSHEYGHHIQYHFIDLPTPDYCNGICDDPGRCSHCSWCEENPRDAWSEGFANWIADATTLHWDTEYEAPPQYHRYSDTVGKCSEDGLYNDAWSTEGAFQALLHDIQDYSMDDDPIAEGFHDRLYLGTEEILFIHLETDYWSKSAENFIEKFMFFYPEYSARLWEVARNCGFTGIDTEPPITPTPTASHNGTPSPDATITINWPEGFDLLSGIGGYSFELSQNTYIEPSSTFYDRDSYFREFTSQVLTPGTYYFTLRAFDREGLPDDGYKLIGPLVIRAAEPGDLEPYADGGWDYPVIPRSDHDSGGYVQAQTGLISRDTYWNLDIINNGDIDIPAGTFSAILVDGGIKAGSYAPIIYAHGDEDWNTNMGPIPLQGGRHTFEGQADYYGVEPEADEANNDWAKQWIWAPTVFAGSPNLDRASPPLRDGGWDAIQSGTIWYNCDGLRFVSGTADNFIGIVMWPDDSLNNYDLRLHEPATGSVSGFGGNLGFSTRPNRCIDAVLVNTRNKPQLLHDVGVLNTGSNLGEGYHSEIVYADDLTLNTPLNSTLLPDEAMRLFMFEITSIDAHSIQFNVDTFWNQNRVYLTYYDQDFVTGDLLAYTEVAVADTTGYVQLDLLVHPGLHTIAVWRDPRDGPLTTRNFTLVVGQPPPDLTSRQPTGWDAAIVPRPGPDATQSWAALPASLPGDVPSTYLNYSFMNASLGASPGFPTSVYVDGVTKHTTNVTSLPANLGLNVLPQTGYEVSGGRHMVTLRCDFNQEVNELIETNNGYGTQYIWEPVPLVLDTPQVRPEPGYRTAFWEYASSEHALWYNCDGVRTPLFQPSGDQGYWGVVATLPASDSDVDLRLHDVSAGITDGFDAPLVSSTWPPSNSDFILMNFNITSTRQFDTGILRTPASKDDPFKVVTAQSQFHGSDPDGEFGPFHLPTTALVALHEFQFTGTGIGHYEAGLISEGSVADLGLSLYGPDQSSYGKSNVFNDGVSDPAMAWIEPAGTEEWFDFIVDTPGYYCLAVWKVGSGDADLAADYLLRVQPVTPAGIGDSDLPPRSTRLAGVYPNPFNPQTTVAFELAAPERVSLRVYDLRGRQVKVLADEHLSAGRHERTWDGRDASGRTVASGSYLVRMTAGATTQTVRANMLK